MVEASNVLCVCFYSVLYRHCQYNEYSIFNRNIQIRTETDHGSNLVRRWGLKLLVKMKLTERYTSKIGIGVSRENC